MFGDMTTLDPHTQMSLDDRLRRAVAAWRIRHGMSARRFGVEALGDPDFVFAQERGRSVRLATADRVLVFMGRPPLGTAFRSQVEAFLEVTGTKVRCWQRATRQTVLCWDGHSGGGRRRGSKTVDRVRAWMAAHASEEETPPYASG